MLDRRDRVRFAPDSQQRPVVDLHRGGHDPETGPGCSWHGGWSFHPGWPSDQQRVPRWRAEASLRPGLDLAGLCWHPDKRSFVPLGLIHGTWFRLPTWVTEVLGSGRHRQRIRVVSPMEAGRCQAQRGDAAGNGRRGSARALASMSRCATSRGQGRCPGVGTIYRHFPTRADLHRWHPPTPGRGMCWGWSSAAGEQQHAARRAGSVDQPVRRLPGHQARPRQGIAVRRCRFRDAARLLSRSLGPCVWPGAVRGPCQVAGRDSRGLMHWRLRTDAGRRQPLYRRGQQPRYDARQDGRIRHRRTAPPLAILYGRASQRCRAGGCHDVPVEFLRPTGVSLVAHCYRMMGLPRGRGRDAGDDAVAAEGPRPVRPHARIVADLAVPDCDQRMSHGAGGAYAAAAAVRAGRRRATIPARRWTPHLSIPGYSRFPMRGSTWGCGRTFGSRWWLPPQVLVAAAAGRPGTPRGTGIQRGRGRCPAWDHGPGRQQHTEERALPALAQVGDPGEVSEPDDPEVTAVTRAIRPGLRGGRCFRARQAPHRRGGPGDAAGAAVVPRQPRVHRPVHPPCVRDARDGLGNAAPHRHGSPRSPLTPEPGGAPRLHTLQVLTVVGNRVARNVVFGDPRRRGIWPPWSDLHQRVSPGAMSRAGAGKYRWASTEGDSNMSVIVIEFITLDGIVSDPWRLDGTGGRMAGRSSMAPKPSPATSSGSRY